MDIQSLIQEACEKDAKFKKKYERHLKNNKIKFNWLMKNLEEILGKIYMRNAAQAQIKKMQMEQLIQQAQG